MYVCVRACVCVCVCHTQEPNVKYLTLETLSRLALVPEILEAIRHHQGTVLQSLKVRACVCVSLCVCVCVVSHLNVLHTDIGTYNDSPAYLPLQLQMDPAAGPAAEGV